MPQRQAIKKLSSWKNIPFEITYYESYFGKGEDWAVDHIEIRCDQPLPITETGYKSLWMTDGIFNSIEDVEKWILEEFEKLDPDPDQMMLL